MRRLAMLFFAMLVAVTAFGQTPIADIQMVDDPGTDDASPMVGETVTVQGWVTFEPMSWGGGQFVMADGAGAWNAIHVYVGGENNWGFGWEVEVTGVVEENYGLTQLNASDGNVTVLDDRQDAQAFWSAWHNDEIAPLTYTDIADPGMLSDPATAEQYEGVLVRLADVTVGSMPGQYGEWTVTDGSGTCAVDNPADDVFGYAHHVVEGQSYDRLQGILNYSFSEYKILPEISWDLKITVDEVNGYYDQIAYAQQVRPMDATIRYDADNEAFTWDQSYASRVRYGLNQGGNDPYGEAVVIHALVSYPTELGYAGDGAKFIMIDYLNNPDTMERWQSVLSYNEDPGTLGDLYVGDEIIFYGEVGEYTTGPSNMTEFWITDPFVFQDEGLDVPVAAQVDIEQLRNTMYAETWGNVFVELNDVVVTDLEPTTYELFSVDDILDDEWGAIKVDDDSDAMGDYQDPALGANIESIVGWMYHHFGVLDNDTDNLDWVYSICPSYPDDILIGEGPPNILSASRDYGVVPPNQDVVVSATIADNEEVDNGKVYYRIDGGDWVEVDMNNIGGLEWEGTIPGQTEDAFVEYYVQAEDDLGQISTLPASLDNGYLGYWAKEDLAIYDVQYTPWASGNSPYAGYDVTVTGVVTSTSANSTDYIDDSGSDADTPPTYWIQGAGDVPYNSISIHIPDETVELGDEITITGTVNELGEPWTYKYGGYTRIVCLPGTTTINSSGNAVTVTPVTIDALNSALEPHEAVVLSLSNVTVTEVNSYDWSIDDGTGSFLLDDDMVNDQQDIVDVFASLTGGTTIDNLTGILVYSFGSWKLEVRMLDDFGTVGVDEDAAAAPLTFALAPVYPNPFNPSANINFSLPVAGQAKLVVFNMMGQQVTTLVNETLQAGDHTALWNASNQASGTYFLQLVAGDQQQVRKMVLMK